MHSHSSQSLGHSQVFGVAEGFLYTVELIYEFSC